MEISTDKNNTPENPRLTVLKALNKVFGQDGYSNIVLDNALEESGQSGRDASFVSALFYGVIERKITLDYIISRLSSIRLKKIDPQILNILRMGVYQMYFMDKVPESAAVNESVKLSKKVYNGRFSAFANAVLRSAGRERKNIKYPPENKITEFLSVKYSCPEKLVEHFIKSCGRESAEGILKKSLTAPPVVVRVNSNLMKTEELIQRLERRGVKAKCFTDIPYALELSEVGSIEALDEHKNGYFHVQDISSQLCCHALSPDSGDKVADVCAAPGGKTYTIAQMMEGKGEILACDKYPEKQRLIESGAKRLGLDNIKTIVRDAAGERLPEMYDKILVDAPCSGLGVIRRKPEIKYKDFESNLPEIQLEILENSSKYVKKGGIMVYSTCTINPSENEDVVNDFLEKNKDFSLLEKELPIVGKTSMITLLPHLYDTDGFFIAIMTRKG